MTINSDVRFKILGLIRDSLNLNDEVDLVDDTNLYDLGIDSLKLVSLMIGLEESQGLILDADLIEAETFERLGSFLEIVEKSQQDMGGGGRQAVGLTAPHQRQEPE